MNKFDSQIITTERLYLRELNPRILKLVMKEYSDDEMMVYFGLKSQEEVQFQKDRIVQGFTMYGISFCYFYLIEKTSGNNIGWCGFHKWYTGHARGELGYVMTDEPSKGKGYMKETLVAVLKYGFETMKLHRVEAMVAAWNDPSLKLLKGNGFVEEGNLREHYFENNIYDDSLMFSLLVGEYAASTK